MAVSVGCVIGDVVRCTAGDIIDCVSDIFVCFVGFSYWWHNLSGCGIVDFLDCAIGDIVGNKFRKIIIFLTLPQSIVK